MGNKYDSLLQLGGAVSQIGASLDPNADGPARRLGAAGYDAVQAEIMRREMDRQKEEQGKKKKANVGRMLGSAAGTVAGILLAPYTGGTSLALSKAAMAGLGSAVGSAAGTKVAGGDVRLGDVVRDGLTSAVSAYAAPALLGAASKMPGGLGRMAGALKDMPGAMGAEAMDQAVARGSAHPALWGRLANGAGTAMQTFGAKSLIGRMLGGFGLDGEPEQDPYGYSYPPQYGYSPYGGGY